MAKRMTGVSFPAPRNADERLTEIVLRACAYKPADRYPGPADMRLALEAPIPPVKEPPAKKIFFDVDPTQSGSGCEESGMDETVGNWSSFPTGTAGEQVQSASSVNTEASE